MEHIVLVGDGFATFDLDPLDVGNDEGGGGGTDALCVAIPDGVRFSLDAETCAAIKEETTARTICVLSAIEDIDGLVVHGMFLHRRGPRFEFGGIVAAVCDEPRRLPPAWQAGFTVELWNHETHQVVAAWAGRWRGPSDPLVLDLD